MEMIRQQNDGKQCKGPIRSNRVERFMEAAACQVGVRKADNGASRP